MTDMPPLMREAILRRTIDDLQRQLIAIKHGVNWRDVWLENCEAMRAAGESKEMAGRWFGGKARDAIEAACNEVVTMTNGPECVASLSPQCDWQDTNTFKGARQDE